MSVISHIPLNAQLVVSWDQVSSYVLYLLLVGTVRDPMCSKCC